MPKMLDSIHYCSDDLALSSIVDIRLENNIREYAVSLFDCHVLEARIIFTDLEDAQDRALEHLAKYYDEELVDA